MPEQHPTSKVAESDFPEDLMFLKDLGFVHGDPNILRDTLLYLAGRCGYVYPLKIAKLLYLAELEHINRVGKRLTSAEFLHDKYGPNPREVFLVVDFLEVGGWIESSVETTRRGHVMTKIKPARSPSRIGLSPDAIKTLDIIVSRWKFRSTDAIVEATKGTEPFRNTPKGEKIDLDDYLVGRNLLAGDSVQEQVRESEQDIKEGRVTKFSSKSRAMAHLKSL